MKTNDLVFSEETSTKWCSDRETNLFFLRVTELFLNNKLREKGYLTTNAVYEALGMERPLGTKAILLTYYPEEWETYGQLSNDYKISFVDFGLVTEENILSDKNEFTIHLNWEPL